MSDAIIYLVLIAIIVTIYFAVRRMSGGRSSRRLQPIPVPVRDDRRQPLTPVRDFSPRPAPVYEGPTLVELVELHLSAHVPRTAKTIYRRMRKSGINMPFSVKTVEQMLKKLVSNHHTVIHRRVPGAKRPGYLAA